MRIASKEEFKSFVLVDPPLGTSCVSPQFKEAVISMSYTGNMSESNSKMSEGTLSIHATFMDGTNTTLDSYSANSGPSGVGSIPDGSYTASKIEGTSQSGMKRDGVGFKVWISDNSDKCRTDLRIHPDGKEAVGTAGCIGITEDASRLKDFQSKVKSYLKDGSTFVVTVLVNGNPNLSDCDETGKKIGKTPTNGN
jgi:hypothetical protein